MPLAGPTFRRPRTSTGPVDLGNNSDGGSANQPVVDADFRRRHSRQNKEIIAENVRHKTALRTLQDEITSLRDELLEVKATNRKLAVQMRTMRHGSDRLRNQATLAVIDNLIASLPGLKDLRDSLAADSDKSTIEMDLNGGRLAGQMTGPRTAGVTIATRPAAAGAASGGLTSLREVNEGEWEDVEEMVFPTISVEQRRTPRRKSGAGGGSRSAPQSPIPLGLRDLPPLPLPAMSTNNSQSISISTSSSTPSPSSSSSPTPVVKKRFSPVKTKRRRESGLLRPIAVVTPQARASRRVQEDEQATATTKATDVLPAEDLLVEESESCCRVPVSAAPTDTVSQNPISRGKKQETNVTNLRNISGATAVSTVMDLQQHPQTAEETLSETVSLSVSSTSSASGPSGPTEASMSAEEDGPRGRRVRKSVNYKEPSLTKKMRKPDGMSAEETLRLSSRSSIGGAGHTSDPSLTTHLNSTLGGGGMRRKSVLPKSSSRSLFLAVNTPLPNEHGQDEEDVDETLLLDGPASEEKTVEELEERFQAGHGERVGVSPAEPASSVSTLAGSHHNNNGIENNPASAMPVVARETQARAGRVTGAINPRGSIATITPAVQAKSDKAATPSGTQTRTSPRKPTSTTSTSTALGAELNRIVTAKPTSRRSSVVPRPKIAPSVGLVHLQSTNAHGRRRDALSDIPESNLHPLPPVGSGIKGRGAAGGGAATAVHVGK